MTFEVQWVPARGKWALITTGGGVDDITLHDTEQAAWVASGLPQPPGRMPVTEKDWE